MDNKIENEVKVIGYENTGIGFRTYYDNGTWHEVSDDGQGLEKDGNHNYTREHFRAKEREMAMLQSDEYQEFLRNPSYETAWGAILTKLNYSDESFEDSIEQKGKCR